MARPVQNGREILTASRHFHSWVERLDVDTTHEMGKVMDTLADRLYPSSTAHYIGRDWE